MKKLLCCIFLAQSTSPTPVDRISVETKDLLYSDVCNNNSSDCDYSWNKKVSLISRFPPEIIFSKDIFEEQRAPHEFPQSKL